MTNWVCCLELLEKLESCVLLELKALHEGAWKMGKFMAFFPVTYYASHTGAVHLVEGCAEGTARTPGDAY